MDLRGKKLVVVGLGRTGAAAARLCAARGANVTISDPYPAEVLEPRWRPILPPEIRREFGGHRLETFLAADLLVLSPGVPPLPEVAAARAAGVPVTGELELASRFIQARTVAITGTNGKSTTTSLCGAMLAASGRPTFVGGNLGEPLSAAVGTPRGSAGGICVVEASSFQLETVERFRPNVAALLNVTPDHLDRHGDMESYVAAKLRLFSAQGPGDHAVVNADDPVAEGATRAARSGRLLFSSRRLLQEGSWLEGGDLFLRLPDGPVERYPARTNGLLGRHNQENALAALLVARLAGASPDDIRAALRSFQPLPHRMTPVADARGVAYFDDSKGTNVGAVVAALSGFPRPVVLIAGGRHKGGSYAPLADVLRGVGRGAVVIGEASEALAATLSPVVPVVRAASMEDAVRQAAALARPGDAVILSPACSSFDMFRDYHHRGEVFRAAVEQVVRSA